MKNKQKKQGKAKQTNKQSKQYQPISSNDLKTNKQAIQQLCCPHYPEFLWFQICAHGCYKQQHR